MIRLLLIVVMMCVFSPVSAKDEPTPAELARTHGLVTVRIHYAGLPPGIANPMASDISANLGLQPAGDEKFKNLQWVSGRNPTDESPGAWIPAGKYRVAIWRGGLWPDGPEIEVVAGRVLDLGDLMEVSVGGLEVVLLPLPHEGSEHALEPWLAKLDGVLVDREPLRMGPILRPTPITVSLGGSASYGSGFFEAALADGALKKSRGRQVVPPRKRLRSISDLAEFRREALDTLPPLRDVSVVDATGRQYFGAALGRIRVREPDGIWRTLDTGAVGPVAALYFDGDRLLAGIGGGDAEIRELKPGGEWIRLKAFTVGDNVEHITRAEGRWFVALTQGQWPGGTPYLDRLVVQSGKADDLSDLAVLRKFDAQNQLPRWHWYPHGYVLAGGYLVNARDELWRLDLTSGDWTRIEAWSPGRIYVSPTTGAITVSAGAYFGQGDAGGGRTTFAADMASEWVKLKWGGGGPYEAWLDSPGQGWAVGSKKMVYMKRVVPTAIARRTGEEWEVVTSTPANCNLVLRDATGVPSFCASAVGTIMRREGAEWVPEFVAE